MWHRKSNENCNIHYYIRDFGKYKILDTTFHVTDNVTQVCIPMAELDAEQKDHFERTLGHSANRSENNSHTLSGGFSAGILNIEVSEIAIELHWAKKFVSEGKAFRTMKRLERPNQGPSNKKTEDRLTAETALQGCGFQPIYGTYC